MDTAAFHDLVARDVRNRTTPEEAAWLRAPEQLDAWYDALTALIHSVDLQFTAKRAETHERRRQYARNPDAWSAYLERIAQWRIKVLDFKGHILDRLHEARALRRTHVPAASVSTEGISRLIRAIETHQAAVLHDSGADDEVDEALWNALNDDEVQALRKLFVA